MMFPPPRYRHVAGSLLFLASSLMAVQAMSQTKGQPDPNIAGKWQIVEMTMNGNKIPANELANASVEIQGDQFTLAKPPNGELSTSRLSVAFQGGRSTLTLESADGKKDKPITGIYKFDDKALILCMTDKRSETNPTSFESKKGTYHVLVRLERAER